MLERIKTAIILVLLVTLCMFATSNPIPMLLLMGVALVIGAREWLQMMPDLGSSSNKNIFVALAPILGLILLAFNEYFPHTWLILWGVATLFWFVALSWVTRYPENTSWFTTKKLYPIGLLLLTSTVTGIFALWQQSPWWLMYVFALVWSADSGAYFVGRKLGKTKMAPNVSPAKSVEGLMGGLTLTTIIIVLIASQKLQLHGAKLAYFLVLSWITVFASVLGDLFESMLKRNAKIKDSGTILPGHGGVLDRIDSLLSAVPVFAFGFFMAMYFFKGSF